MKAETLNVKIEEDIQAKTTAIENLQRKLAASESTQAEVQKFMKDIEKFI